MDKVLLFGRLAAVFALLCMIVGHMGNTDLHWAVNQVSTYAAEGAFDNLVTTAMLLAAAMILAIGVLVGRYQVLGDSTLAHGVPPLAGAAASGLMMLAAYEETSRTWEQLTRAGTMAIRQQSFHDAGLQIFYFGSLALVLLLGILAVMNSTRRSGRVAGAAIALLGLISFLSHRIPWADLFGIEGNAWGLTQRAGLFCLWLAAAVFLAALPRISVAPAAALQAPEKGL